MTCNIMILYSHLLLEEMDNKCLLFKETPILMSNGILILQQKKHLY